MVTSSSMLVDGRAKKIIMLVGGLEHFLFFHLLGMSSSQLTNSYFSEGYIGIPPTSMSFMIQVIADSEIHTEVLGWTLGSY